MARPKSDYDDEAIAMRLRDAFGNLTAAAKALNVSRAYLEKRIEASEYLQGVLKNAREQLVDLAEASLLNMVTGGHFGATRFTLKTLGKQRGYTERTELTGADGAPLGVDATLLERIMRHGYDVNSILRAVLAQLEQGDQTGNAAK